MASKSASTNEIYNNELVCNDGPHQTISSEKVNKYAVVHYNKTSQWLVSITSSLDVTNL